MDALTLAAGVTAVAGLCAGWHMRQRARRAEAEAAALRFELRAERHAASHDPLTGLPNRRAFYQLGAALVGHPAQHPLIAVVLDLDNFKQINDEFGHGAGDEVLIIVARRFAMYAGDDLVARLGGDEFAGLLTGSACDQRRLDQAERALAERLAAPMQVAGRTVSVTVSVGMVPVHGPVRLTDAIHHADAAMYRAKTRRGTSYFDPVIDDHLVCHPDVRPAPYPPVPYPAVSYPPVPRAPSIATPSVSHAATHAATTHAATWLTEHTRIQPAPPRQLADTTPRAEPGGL